MRLSCWLSTEGFGARRQGVLQLRLRHSERLIGTNSSCALIVVEWKVYAQNLPVSLSGSREDISVSRSRNGKAWCRNKTSAWRTVETTLCPQE